MQLQFRARVNYFLTQLQFVSCVELILYAVTIFPLCRINFYAWQFSRCVWSVHAEGDNWMALGIFSEDCICTSLWEGALGTFTLRKLNMCPGGNHQHENTTTSWVINLSSCSCVEGQHGHRVVVYNTTPHHTWDSWWVREALQHGAKLVDKIFLIFTVCVDRYTRHTQHFHTFSNCTDHTAHMTCVLGSSLSCVPNIGRPSTRHVSPCASQHTEHQHKFSLTYLSCVTVVLFSEPRPVVQASISPLCRSKAGWYFYGIPLLHRLWAQKDRAQQDSGQPSKSNNWRPGGVKPLSYSQSLIHSAYDSAEHCDATRLGPRRRAIT